MMATAVLIVAVGGFWIAALEIHLLTDDISGNFPQERLARAALDGSQSDSLKGLYEEWVADLSKFPGSGSPAVYRLFSWDGLLALLLATSAAAIIYITGIRGRARGRWLLLLVPIGFLVAEATEFVLLRGASYGPTGLLEFARAQPEVFTAPDQATAFGPGWLDKSWSVGPLNLRAAWVPLAASATKWVLVLAAMSLIPAPSLVGATWFTGWQSEASAPSSAWAVVPGFLRWVLWHLARIMLRITLTISLIATGGATFLLVLSVVSIGAPMVAIATLAALPLIVLKLGSRSLLCFLVLWLGVLVALIVVLLLVRAAGIHPGLREVVIVGGLGWALAASAIGLFAFLQLGLGEEPEDLPPVPEPDGGELVADLRTVLGPFAEPLREYDVALEGASLKSVAQAGALMAFHDAGMTARMIAGASGGAPIAAALAAGYEPREIAKRALETDWLSLLDPRDYPASSLLQRPWYALAMLLPPFVFRRGASAGDLFEEQTRNMLAEQFPPGIDDPTFCDVADDSTGKRLKLVATDLTRRKPVVFPDDAAMYCRHVAEPCPDDGKCLSASTLSVAHAVRMSISIPGLFEPVQLRYVGGPGNPVIVDIVDAGIISGYPIWAFDRNHPSVPTWGLLLDESEPFGGVGSSADPQELTNVAQVLAATVNTGIGAGDRFTSEHDDERTVRIRAGGVNGKDVNFERDLQVQLVKEGYAAAKAFIQNWNWDKYIEKHRGGVARVPRSYDVAAVTIDQVASEDVVEQDGDVWYLRYKEPDPVCS